MLKGYLHQTEESPLPFLPCYPSNGIAISAIFQIGWLLNPNSYPDLEVLIRAVLWNCHFVPLRCSWAIWCWSDYNLKNRIFYDKTVKIHCFLPLHFKEGSSKPICFAYSPRLNHLSRALFRNRSETFICSCKQSICDDLVASTRDLVS